MDERLMQYVDDALRDKLAKWIGNSIEMCLMAGMSSEEASRMICRVLLRAAVSTWR